MRVQRRAKSAFCLALFILAAGCGNAPQNVAGGATTAATGPESPPTQTTSAPAGPSQTASAAPASPTPTDPPVVMGKPGSGKKKLVLADAFNPGQWTEGSYTPANETEPVSAMATEVRCGSRAAKTVEYRFAQVEGRLTAQVAQDMYSESPDLELEYSLTADGRQVDVKNGDFKGKPELSTDLAGVTVLRISVKGAPGTTNQCSSSQSANALITSVIIEQ